MTEYTKFIGLMSRMYTREFDKIKHHRNKVREINESTVAKAFLEGKAMVRVIIEDKDEEYLITPDSPPEEIKKYLGKAFIK